MYNCDYCRYFFILASPELRVYSSIGVVPCIQKYKAFQCSVWFITKLILSSFTFPYICHFLYHIRHNISDRSIIIPECFVYWFHIFLVLFLISCCIGFDCKDIRGLIWRLEVFWSCIRLYCVVSFWHLVADIFQLGGTFFEGKNDFKKFFLEEVNMRIWNNGIDNICIGCEGIRRLSFRLRIGDKYLRRFGLCATH